MGERYGLLSDTSYLLEAKGFFQKKKFLGFSYTFAICFPFTRFHAGWKAGMYVSSSQARICHSIWSGLNYDPGIYRAISRRERNLYPLITLNRHRREQKAVRAGKTVSVIARLSEEGTRNLPDRLVDLFGRMSTSTKQLLVVLDHKPDLQRLVEELMM